ncbi:MAG TPA: PIG-L family deacetylase [Actinomycetota bacterium]|nr:PIG-L family deacetylase [Actinomycetota bacterium]HRY09869.1 PIG-L family deacetylase [Candidatus Nanopelagicales bacterium]
MIPLSLPAGSLRVLLLGAHPDDIEIGAGGTLLRWDREVSDLQVHYVVMTGDRIREEEAQAGAAAFMPSAALDVTVHDLPDGYLPAHWSQVKELLEAVAARTTPDVVVCPSQRDAHQDHRTVAEIVPSVFRDCLTLQYEIPKWDGDLGSGHPTHYVRLCEEDMTRKCHLLAEHFATQTNRDWFTAETFRGLGRLRGIECRAAFAEAFTVGKAVLEIAKEET